jgi:hypothetical protein
MLRQTTAASPGVTGFTALIAAAFISSDSIALKGCDIRERDLIDEHEVEPAVERGSQRLIANAQQARPR